MQHLNDITGTVVDCAIRLHRTLGPGLLESIYETALAHDLRKRGLKVERQKSVRFEYDGCVFPSAFRVDLLIEDQVVVELKSVEELAPVHAKQVLTYLRIMGLRVGLLMNFGDVVMKHGIHRIINGYGPGDSNQQSIHSP